MAISVRDVLCSFCCSDIDNWHCQIYTIRLMPQWGHTAVGHVMECPCLSDTNSIQGHVALLSGHPSRTPACTHVCYILAQVTPPPPPTPTFDPNPVHQSGSFGHYTVMCVVYREWRRAGWRLGGGEGAHTWSVIELENNLFSSSMCFRVYLICYWSGAYLIC